MADERDVTRTGNGTNAASMIAELWAEREQARSQSSPTRAVGPPPKPPRPNMGGKERALAAAVAVLLVGSALGLVAIAEGFIGAPSKATFVAEADSICSAGNGGATSIAKPTSYPALATAASTLVVTTETQLPQLRALELPGGLDRGGARAVLDAMTATGVAGRNMQAAAGASDHALTGAAYQLMTTYSKDAVAKARTFGLSACATGMQPGVDAVTSGAKGIVKDAFIVKGNQICGGLDRAMAQLRQPTNQRDLARYIGQAGAVLDKMIADFKALPAPPGDELTLTELYTSMDTVNAKAKEYFGAMVALDAPRVKVLEKEFNSLDSVVGNKLLDYGLDGCADES